VIEMCHEADLHARAATRSKVKVDDFQFALRNDARKLGRIVELMEVNRQIQKKRDMFKNQSNKNEAAAAGVNAAVTNGAGDEDDEMRELVDLVESGRSKKGKAKALREDAASKASKKKKINANLDDMDDMDVDAMED
jgi:hypothetical protein